MTGYKHRLFKRLEVYYSDLTEKAKKEVLAFYGLEDPDIKFEITPLFEIVKIENT